MAYSRVECVTDRDVNVFVGVPIAGIAIDNDLTSRDREYEMNFVVVALGASAINRFYDDPSAGDPIRMPLHRRNLLANARFDRG